MCFAHNFLRFFSLDFLFLNCKKDVHATSYKNSLVQKSDMDTQNHTNTHNLIYRDAPYYVWDVWNEEEKSSYLLGLYKYE